MSRLVHEGSTEGRSLPVPSVDAPTPAVCRHSRRWLAAVVRGARLGLSWAARPKGLARLAATLVIATTPTVVVHAAARVRSEVDAQRIGVEDRLQLTVSLDGSVAGDVAMPALENLRVLGGPSVSTQISLVNGQMSQSKTYTWTLQALAVGRAKVGEVKAGTDVAPAIVIEVVDGSVRPRQRVRAADPFGDPFEELLGRRTARTADPRLFVEATASRTKLRVGEATRVSFWLYTQVQVVRPEFAEAPQFPGLWVEDLQRDEAPKTEAVVRDGERFQRALLVDKLVFPTRAGKLVLPPARFRISVAPQGFFDSGATVLRATKAIELDVEALPEEAGFAGAVGHFKARTTLDRPTLPLGEAATLRFRVEGTGNLKWIDKPPEVVVPGARVFPPQVKTEIKAGEGGMNGSRTWEFVVVPETAGRLVIPSLTFKHFDPDASRIVTTETTAIELTVEGGTGAAVAPASSQTAPAAARGSAPLPLRSDLDARRPWVPTIPARGLLFLLGVLIFGHLAFVVVPLLGHLTHARPTGRKGSTSRGALRDLERVARGGLGRQEATLLLEKALHQTFGELPEDGSGDGDRERAARVLFDDVRSVRYAPQLGDYSEALSAIASRAAEVARRWA